MQVSRFTLSEIVDTSVLQEIQDKFAEATDWRQLSWIPKAARLPSPAISLVFAIMFAPLMRDFAAV